MNNNLLRPLSFLFLVLSFLVAGAQISAVAQDEAKKPKLNSESKQSRDYALSMLDEMKDIMKEYYYDPSYHGIDFKTRIETAKARVKTLEYNWQMYRVLVQVLMELNDSHTRMLLPPRTDHFQYGVVWQMIGNDCVVTSVAKDSDAFAQGLEPGDQILKVGNYTPTRDDLWKINYLIYKLDPSKQLPLKIKKADGSERSVTINSSTKTEKQYLADLKAKKDKEKYEPFKCTEMSKDLLACKLYSFVVEKGDVDKMMKQARAYPKLILDLRGNGGGYVSIEQYLLSSFFDHQVKIADMVSKGKTETESTKVLDAEKQYKGEVSVLVDSNSASAAEMTARVLQLEKRAKIYGDYSSGRVMTSIQVPFRSIMSLLADAAIIHVGMTVTVADVKMSDGSRLENTGVVPDEVLQPTSDAIKRRTDAVLAYVASKSGVATTPEAAGKLYFITQKDEDEDQKDTKAEDK